MLRNRITKEIFMKVFVLFLVAGLCLSPVYADVPHDGRFARAEFVSSLVKPGDVGAEIGVSFGIFAYHVLLQNQPSKLYLIDPWEYGLQRDVELDPTPEKQCFRDAEYEVVCKLFAPYSNVEIVREKSEDAVIHFPDQFFDYVYIDGEHSYDAVKRDLSNYFPKIKVGGYLIGDDYGWTGIAQAVQEFLSEHQNELFWLGDPYLGKTGGQFAMRRLK
jgi:hypothetical protein